MRHEREDASGAPAALALKINRRADSAVRNSYLKFMHRGVFAQSMVIVWGTAIIFTPSIVGILYIMGIMEMKDYTFVVYKSSFATILTIPVSPIVWMSAMVKYL